VSTIARLEPALSRAGGKLPDEIDGHQVLRCVEVRSYELSTDALFEMADGGQVWACTTDRGKTWASYVSNGGPS